MNPRPFSQACENNKGPILEVLRTELREPGRLLEIGSGTGQHAAWLSGFLPHILWQPSDVQENLPGIRSWLGQAPDNVLPPITLDVDRPEDWPPSPWDYLFTANTLHIMSRASGERCLARGARQLRAGGLFLIYGPFSYAGRHTSPSNAEFDIWLRRRDPASGVRSVEWVQKVLSEQGLELRADHPMPANNRMLVFQGGGETG